MKKTVQELKLQIDHLEYLANKQVLKTNNEIKTLIDKYEQLILEKEKSIKSRDQIILDTETKLKNTIKEYEKNIEFLNANFLNQENKLKDALFKTQNEKMSLENEKSLLIKNNSEKDKQIQTSNVKIEQIEKSLAQVTQEFESTKKSLQTSQLNLAAAQTNNIFLDVLYINDIGNKFNIEEFTKLSIIQTLDRQQRIRILNEVKKFIMLHVFMVATTNFDFQFQLEANLIDEVAMSKNGFLKFVISILGETIKKLKIY